MTHSKFNTQRHEEFYKERQHKQRHLTDYLSENEIRNILTGLDPADIAVLSTLLFNLYEDKFKHIWFAKDIREQHIKDIQDLIEGLEQSPFIKPLDDVFTGMGINDKSTKYK